MGVNVVIRVDRAVIVSGRPQLLVNVDCGALVRSDVEGADAEIDVRRGAVVRRDRRVIRASVNVYGRVDEIHVVVARAG